MTAARGAPLAATLLAALAGLAVASAPDPPSVAASEPAPGGGAPAATPAPAPKPDAAFDLAIAPVSVPSGGNGVAVLRLTLHYGDMLLSSGTPQTKAFITSLMVVVEPSEGIFPETAEYPVAETWRMPEDQSEFQVYKGTIEIRVPIRVKKGTAPGSYHLKGRVRYQRVHQGGIGKAAVRPFEFRVDVPAPKGRAAGEAAPAGPSAGAPTRP